MTDEHIIKALECCRNDLGHMCSICPSFDLDNDYCEDELHEHALDLINRQKAEIEGLEETRYDLACTTVELREERNRLLQKLQQAKSEAIKGFVERLKKELRFDDDCSYDCENCCFECKEFIPQIDNLVKEMTEAQE